jgi:hypothetical protein
VEKVFSGVVFCALAIGAGEARGVEVKATRSNKSDDRASRPRGSAETERRIRQAEHRTGENDHFDKLSEAHDQKASLQNRAQALASLGGSKLGLREAFSREIAKYNLVKDIQKSDAVPERQADVAGAVKTLQEGKVVHNWLSRGDLALSKGRAVRGIADQIAGAKNVGEAARAHQALRAAVGADDPGVRRTAEALDRRAWKQAKVGRRLGNTRLTRDALDIARKASADTRREFDQDKAQRFRADTAERAAERFIADGNYVEADRALYHVIPMANQAPTVAVKRDWARVGAKQQRRLLELHDLAMTARIDDAWMAAERAAKSGDVRGVEARVWEVMRVELRRDRGFAPETRERGRELIARAEAR